MQKNYRWCKIGKIFSLVYMRKTINFLWKKEKKMILLQTLSIWTSSNYTRMLRAILNKSWRQHPTKQQLSGHLSPITKTIKAWRTGHAVHCWRSKDELISDVLLRTPSHGRAKAGRPARTYIQQLSEDTGCSPEDQPEAMNDREEWRGRVRDIYPCWWHDKMMMMMMLNARANFVAYLMPKLFVLSISCKQMRLYFFSRNYGTMLCLFH